MTYFINPIWFYLIHVLDTLNIFGFTIAILGGCGVVLFAVDYAIDAESVYNKNENTSNVIKRFGKFSLTICIIGSILCLLCPSKEICEEMIVASVLTQENVDYTENEVKEIIDYIFDKIDGVESDEENE